MMGLIENQVYLAQSEWAKVIAHSEALLVACEAMHYALVALHVRIQAAAAYVMLGKQDAAQAMLLAARDAAQPDGLFMPFAENYRYLRTLPAIQAGALAPRIAEAGEAFEARCEALRCGGAHPAAFQLLTEREKQIAQLVAARLSNREIAEKLFLSEGSVKQYVNQIYAKLHIDGDVRTKRRRLAESLTNG